MDARILLVDDDPTFLKLELPLVEEIAGGRTVASACGPQEALEVLAAWDRGNVRAMVITDYIMPEMTGMDLIRAARELHPNASFDYACLTTVFHSTVLARTKQAGAVRAEVKPGDIGALRETLHSILRPWLRGLEIAA